MLTGSTSAGGSVQSAHGYNMSQNQSWANTAGEAATAQNMASAQKANQQQLDMMRETMRFNAEEAQKQREWQERMANTVYTRSVANMKEAGINPILAASMGLSGASVGSGASANISAPSAHMGTAIAEQNSASTGSAYGENWSSGSSWNESNSGLAEGLRQMGQLVSSALAAMNSAHELNINLGGLGSLTGDKNGNITLKDGTGEKTTANEVINEAARLTGKAALGVIDKVMNNEKKNLGNGLYQVGKSGSPSTFMYYYDDKGKKHYIQGYK